MIYLVGDLAPLKIGSRRAKPIVGVALVLALVVAALSIAQGIWFAYGIATAF
jgi:hypothetical protein